MTDIVVVSLLSNLDRSHTQCNASRRHLRVEMTFNQFLKMLGEIKSILKCKSEKLPEADSAPVIDLKMGLLVKTDPKRSILDVSQF